MTGIDAVGQLAPPSAGLRRFDPTRDLRPVIALLQLGFGADLDDRDRRWLEELDHLSGAGPLLGWAFRLLPAAENVFSGYVWVEDGRVVANASLMRAAPRIWTIANVVTDPAYRRRGIARRLVVAAVDGARAHGARQVQLQVRDDNTSARALYRQLGFRRLFSTTTWRREGPLEVPAAAEPDGWRPLRWPRHARWRVESVLARAGEIEGPPPGPVRQALLRQGLRGSFSDRLRGVQRYPWAAMAETGYVSVAAASAQGGGAPHLLEAWVEPRWRGQVEALLLARMLSDLRPHPAPAVDAEVRDSETGMAAAVEAAGFRPVRTLERMTRPL
jgi:ribosomal protein S18 acetylase RimI-like enzyme